MVDETMNLCAAFEIKSTVDTLNLGKLIMMVGSIGEGMVNYSFEYQYNK